MGSVSCGGCNRKQDIPELILLVDNHVRFAMDFPTGWLAGYSPEKILTIACNQPACQKWYEDKVNPPNRVDPALVLDLMNRLTIAEARIETLERRLALSPTQLS